jgi:katanin p60 ATPase-containing subunit A1
VGQKPSQRKERVGNNGTSAGTKKAAALEEPEESIEERLIKPLPAYLFDSEFRPLAEMITREIFQKNPNVRWDDVIGLNETKRLLKEAVVMPLKYPQLFQGLLSPWCGILLYGPPGNGKTMLAKAVATECRTTFFNISASSIVSKYRGDSEKLIRILFELARHHAPSTIFLDEIDSIMGQRDSGGGGQEHEASRRMKTELLIQMDGLSKTNDVVFVLAASNLPWELDAAMLRRLEKRVLVDLPSADARYSLFSSLLQPYAPPAFPYEAAVNRTEGYSGADIKLVSKEACMAPVRRLMDRLE